MIVWGILLFIRQVVSKLHILFSCFPWVDRFSIDFLFFLERLKELSRHRCFCKRQLFATNCFRQLTKTTIPPMNKQRFFCFQVWDTSTKKMSYIFFSNTLKGISIFRWNILTIKWWKFGLKTQKTSSRRQKKSYNSTILSCLLQAERKSSDVSCWNIK